MVYFDENIVSLFYKTFNQIFVHKKFHNNSPQQAIPKCFPNQIKSLLPLPELGEKITKKS